MLEVLTLIGWELTFRDFTVESMAGREVKSRLMLPYGSGEPRGSVLMRLMTLWLLNGREGRSLPQSDSCVLTVIDFKNKELATIIPDTWLHTSVWQNSFYYQVYASKSGVWQTDLPLPLPCKTQSTTHQYYQQAYTSNHVYPLRG